MKFYNDLDLFGELRNIVVESFNKADRPDAAAHTGRIIFVPDMGIAGEIQVANGTEWLGIQTMLPSTLSVSGPITSTSNTATGEVTIAIQAASASQHGYMSSTDKAKLDASASAASGNTLVFRDANGSFSAATITADTVTGLDAPTNVTDAVNKQYVDDAIAGLGQLKGGWSASGNVYPDTTSTTTTVSVTTTTTTLAEIFEVDQAKETGIGLVDINPAFAVNGGYITINGKETPNQWIYESDQIAGILVGEHQEFPIEQAQFINLGELIDQASFYILLNQIEGIENVTNGTPVTLYLYSWSDPELASKGQTEGLSQSYRTVTINWATVETDVVVQETVTSASDYADIDKGDYWFVTANGFLGSEPVQPGDIIIASIQTPGQTRTNWIHVETNYNIASTINPGIVELATQTEVNNGTTGNLVVTADKLNNRTALETRAGLIEIATQVEADAGADDARAVTPLKMKEYVRKYGAFNFEVQFVGQDLVGNSYRVTHEFFTTTEKTISPTVRVYQDIAGDDTWEEVLCGIKHLDGDNVDLTLIGANSTDKFKVVVIG